MINLNELEQYDYVIVDTETTDLIKKGIIQLSIIDKNENVLFNQRIKSIHNISKRAFETHHISDDDLKNEKDFAFYYQKISDILKDKIVVGYNIDFDIQAILFNCDDYDLDLIKFKDKFCVMKSVSNLLYRRKWQKLIDVCNDLKIKTDDINFHDSKSDCIVTLRVLKKLQQL